MQLIIDGHNIIHQWKELHDLAKVNIVSAMQKLINLMVDYYNATGMDVCIVFDGHTKPSLMLNSMNNGICIVFSGNTTADAIIERMVYQSQNPGDILVVTADYAQQRIIFGRGAFRVTPSELKKKINTMVMDGNNQSASMPVKLEDHLAKDVVERLKNR
ncbi:NYN domain-containing protein [bacterium]|nr:NYN domain-containing protein [bacterium]